MGKGVGSTSNWVIEIKVGQMIVEFSPTFDINLRAMLLHMANKMPVSVDFVFKNLRY